MRTSTQIVLVLMGGGALAVCASAGLGLSRACQDARARHDPQESSICHVGHGGGGGGGWFGGGSGDGGSARGGSTSVARGGFGFSGFHFGGFGG